ncbi:DUF3800 domain-containing protein [Candidatus Saccharibacteria bacterium]|nr:DUF3800 domain-containing protein [Candidatus Saccharibacteria bacterium]
MLAYSDESGTPGIALHDNDWFFVAIILFKSKDKRDQAKEQIIALRKQLNLPKTYEFHHVDDSKKIQKSFYDLVKKLDFKYRIYGIEKNFNRKFCSEINMANIIVNDIRDIENVSIIIDRNEKLYNKLGKAKKRYRAKNLHFSEGDSVKEDCLQIADYVVCAEMAKRRNKKIPSSIKALGNKMERLVLLKK